MGQARQQQHHLLRLPPALPTRHQPQGLFVLTEGRFDHRPTVVGIGQGGWFPVKSRRHQHRLLIAPLLFGRANHPLPGGPTELMGA